ncbi:UNVERIFIED_CONTAM: hypothetical protein Sradi_2509700 [Sesamum radiatum]|uniref:Uncharacterized protein n=1 Tax=Sesamum radiatum TaxID=300843 RepID=A0AAW2SL78_SESRA
MPGWREFIEAIFGSFDDIEPECMVDEFNKQQQTGSVRESLETFKELKPYMMIFYSHFPDSYFTACFMSGLKEEIRANRRFLTTAELKARRDKNLCYNYEKSSANTFSSRPLPHPRPLQNPRPRPPSRGFPKPPLPCRHLLRATLGSAKALAGGRTVPEVETLVLTSSIFIGFLSRLNVIMPLNGS